MRIIKMSIFIKSPPHDGGGKYRISTEVPGFMYEFFEVLAVFCLWRGVSFRRILFLIIVAKLDNHIVSRFYQFPDLLPPAFINKTFTASAVYGMIIHFNFIPKV